MNLNSDINANSAGMPAEQLHNLAQSIKIWATEFGFQQAGITHCDLSAHEPDFLAWLERGFHGTMEYMARHGTVRTRPAELVPGTVRVISVRMDYLPPHSDAVDVLQDSRKAYISRYALGGDYHKFLRKRLEKLAHRIQDAIGAFGYRAFADSAPVLEKPLAEQAGLGWRGKNTLLLNQEAGSWFFLGELFTDLPLPIDPPTSKEQCGACVACINICPTQAIVAPYQLDARRCISYFTIEHTGSIPEEFRALMGNRIYGCDDCQLVCPWNRYAEATKEMQFHARHGLADASLVDLFLWDETTFLRKTEGSPIRRLGYERWLRNIAIALGNTPSSPDVLHALTLRLQYPSALVQEHVTWALTRHETGTTARADTIVKKLSKKLNPDHY
jgi:epoxyqueuosine reductase